MPSLSFQLLTDPADAALALARFRGHLSPNGRLVISFKAKLWPGRRPPAQGEWTDWFKMAEQERAEDGLTIRRWIRLMFDYAAQLEHEENRYEVLRGDVVLQSETHHRSPAVRWYSQSQALACFEAAGFTDLTITAADTFTPATAEDTLFKITAVRVAPSAEYVESPIARS